MNGFVGQARKGRFFACTSTDNPGCSLTPHEARRDGLPRLARDPELLGLRAATSCSRTTCSSRTLLEPARAPLPGVGLVGALLEARRPDELHSALQARGAARRRAGDGQQAADSPGPTSPTCSTSDHVSWRYYVANGSRARLRGQPDVRARRDAGRHDARHLEPAAVLRRRAAGPPARQHPAGDGTSTRRANGHAAGRVLGHSRAGRQRAPARARHRRPGLRHRADQRDHAQPGLELDRDLPRLGRLGRLLRPRQAARRRRRRLRAPRARRS